MLHFWNACTFVCFVVGCAVASFFILSISPNPFPSSFLSLFLFLLVVLVLLFRPLHPSILTLTRLVWHGSLSLSDVWDGWTLRGNGPPGGSDERPELHHHRLKRCNHTRLNRVLRNNQDIWMNTDLRSALRMTENGSPLHLLHLAWQRNL